MEMFLKVTLQVIIGMLLMLIWKVDIVSVGGFRWFAGWVFGVPLLTSLDDIVDTITNYL